MVLYYLLFFLLCCAALYLAGNWVVEGISRIAKVMKWKEFVVAFFVMALAATLPNLFLAIISVLNKVPELSLGDVMGGNVVDMTLALALAVFFSKDGIDAKSETVQTSLYFTFAAAVAPLALMLDGNLSRLDGAVLLLFFAFYLHWLLSKKERFSIIYKGHPVGTDKKIKVIKKEAGMIIVGLLMLVGVAQAIVSLSHQFSERFDVTLPLVGVLIVGLGNSFPEICFGIMAARTNKSKMILGDIMGAIILPGTMVLGLVALFAPIAIGGPNMFIVARYFLLAAAAFFLLCVRSDRRVTKREAVMLLLIYIAFLMVEILAK